MKHFVLLEMINKSLKFVLWRSLMMKSWKRHTYLSLCRHFKKLSSSGYCLCLVARCRHNLSCGCFHILSNLGSYDHDLFGCALKILETFVEAFCVFLFNWTLKQWKMAKSLDNHVVFFLILDSCFHLDSCSFNVWFWEGELHLIVLIFSCVRIIVSWECMGCLE
jgi:hypothetical protein